MRKDDFFRGLAHDNMYLYQSNHLRIVFVQGKCLIGGYIQAKLSLFEWPKRGIFLRLMSAYVHLFPTNAGCLSHPSSKTPAITTVLSELLAMVSVSVLVLELQGSELVMRGLVDSIGFENGN